MQKHRLNQAKLLFLTLLLNISFLGLCFTQHTVDFEYFRRSAKVDVHYFIKNNSGKTPLPNSSTFTLENSSEEQYFIIEFSNLKLGLDKSGNVKQKKDLEDYFMYIPQDPLSLTVSTEFLQFQSMTNEGYLSDVNTDKANKKVAVYYGFHNNTPTSVTTDLQLKFHIETIEGSRPLKAEHKGGSVIKCQLSIKSNEHYYKQLEHASNENKLYTNFINAQQNAYKIKYARQYLDKFRGINQDRIEEITNYLANVNDYINPLDHDKLMYKQIVKFCVTEKEKERCHSLCTQYQNSVWDNPNEYNGNFLEQSFLHRIELFSDNTNAQWGEYCKKFLYKYPQSQYSYKIQRMYDEYLAEVDLRKNPPKQYLQQSNLVRTPHKRKELVEPEFGIEMEMEMEEELVIPVKEDWASILIHDDNTGVIIRTGGIAEEGYVVEFKDNSDQLIKYDPSFLGEEMSIDLDAVLDGKFKPGDYKVSIFSKIDRKMMASNSIHYNSTKLPPEIKYLLTVGFIVLLYFVYKNYIKL